MTHDPYIVLAGIRKGYRIGGEPIPIFSGLDLVIPRGDFVAIMGPSGSGKSTLLNMLAGIDVPDAGSLSIDNHRLDQMGETARSSWRAHNMGIVFQFYNLLPMLNAAENVELPLLLKPLSAGERRARVGKVLELVGLAGREKQYPAMMSGGQQQRVGIARASFRILACCFATSRPAISTASPPTTCWKCSASSTAPCKRPSSW